MDIELKIDPTYTTPKLTIYTHELTPQLSELITKLSNDSMQLITGIKGESIFLLSPREIFCFFTENQKVFAKTQTGIFKIKSRLYEIENLVLDTSFVRISQSEIVNFSYVESLELELNGTIRLKLKNGDYSYVSRRYVSKIKSYLKL